jgi:parallel beta-helix repeat protein
MLSLLVVSALALAHSVQLVKSYAWTETIYIRADGSISPPTAPISSVDNVTYTLTDNIAGVPASSSTIIIQRGNITIDGAGYALTGTNASGSVGIELTGRSNVTIKNMEIAAFDYGIELDSSDNDSVSGNDITANKEYGIYLNSSSNDNIVGNSVTATQETYIFYVAGYGVGLDYSSNNSVSGNYIANDAYGIRLDYSDNNTLFDNNVTACFLYGFLLSSSSSNTLFGNYVRANDNLGIVLDASSDNNALSSNDVTANKGSGLGLDSSSNNTLSGNNVNANNYNGIWLNSSDNNGLFGNNVTANGATGIMLYYYADNNTLSGNNVANNGVGIYLSGSSNNYIFHNNFVNNTSQDTSSYSTSVWDDGYPSGGNYWSDYAGVDLHSGVYQNATGTDGIGDTPLLINTNWVSNYDRYPLMHPFDPQTQDLAVAIRNLWLQYNSQNQATQNELANVKNTLYVLIAITTILAVALAFVATRKRKIKPETQ